MTLPRIEFFFVVKRIIAKWTVGKQDILGVQFMDISNLALNLEPSRDALVGMMVNVKQWLQEKFQNLQGNLLIASEIYKVIR
jgi:hypothetical protein